MSALRALTRKRRLTGVVLPFLFGPACPVDAWHVPDAPYRIACERAADDTARTAVGHLRLWPQAATLPESIRPSVFSSRGVPLASRILWTAPGEPVELLFDASDTDGIYVYPVDSGNEYPDWEPLAGVVLETRSMPAREGEWADPRTLWHRPSRVLGRSLVPQIHLGIHPHGPERNLMARFRAHLRIDQDGEYAFATLSEDHSFVFINNHQVAAWPGIHSAHGGRQAQHHGLVTLRRGVHLLEYYNVKEGEGFSCSAAWKPPGQPHFEILPHDAFVPVGEFKPAVYETAPDSPLVPFFTWETERHIVDGDCALIEISFSVAHPDRQLTYAWHFDDGSSAEGDAVRHLFLKPGLRTVVLAAQRNGETVAQTKRTVRVQPDWRHPHRWQEEVFESMAARIINAEHDRTPVEDLANVVRLAEQVGNRRLLSAIGRACLERHKDFDPDQADALYKLGFHFQHYEIRQYSSAEQAFRAAIAVCPSPLPIREAAQLHLAGFLIHGRGHADEAELLLGKIERELLPAADQRLLVIFQGDAMLTQGRLESAEALYRSVGIEDHGDPGYRVKRRGRIENAKELLLRAEYDAAETIVRTIEWEAPLERLNTETGRVMIEIHLARQEHPFAFNHCRRLLNTRPHGNERARILYALALSAEGLGFRDEMRDALEQLQAGHRYSEAAALAAERWGRPDRNSSAAP